METEHLAQGHLLVKTRTWFQTEADLGGKAPVYVVCDCSQVSLTKHRVPSTVLSNLQAVRGIFFNSKSKSYV